MIRSYKEGVRPISFEEAQRQSGQLSQREMQLIAARDRDFSTVIERGNILIERGDYSGARDEYMELLEANDQIKDLVEGGTCLRCTNIEY